jgi:non-heme chloroperoxidase
MATVTRDGKMLHYQTYAGKGPTVVLVHGWASSDRVWDPVVSRLVAEGRAVVTLDLRGHGRSDGDFSDLTISALGGDVAALVEELSLERVVLNGWSMGGAIVVDAAGKLEPSRLAGLVLTGGATPRFTSTDDWPFGAPPEVVDGMVQSASAARPATLKTVLDSMCAVDIGEHTREFLWSQMLSSGPLIYNTLHDLRDVDQRGALGAITAPVLLMAGALDGFVPLEAVKASMDLFGTTPQLVVHPESGHVPFLEESETYLAGLSAFLADVN